MSKKYTSGFFGNIYIALMLSIFVVVLFPIPPFFLDILISVSIVYSLLIFYFMFTTEKPVEFYYFPKLISSITIMNLLTSIALSRFILGIGPEYIQRYTVLLGSVSSLFSSININSAAGFIGLIVLLAIFTAASFFQFTKLTMKINKETGDALKANQDDLFEKLNSIDEEIKHKLVTDEKAETRKEELRDRVDYFGEINGVFKYFKSNEKVKLILVALNIAGGIFIGTRFREEYMDEAFVNYISLAISSGIFCAIPSILISFGMKTLLTKEKKT